MLGTFASYETSDDTHYDMLVEIIKLIGLFDNKDFSKF